MEIEGVPGIGPKTLEKLKGIDITTMEQLAITTEDDLKESLNVPRKQARLWIKVAKNKALEKAMIPKSLKDLIRIREEVVQRYSTGSTELDKILGGGVETWALWGLRGQFSTGKTQFGYSVAISCIQTGRKVAWVETESRTFSPDRIMQIAENRGVEVKPEDVPEGDFFVITADLVTDINKQMLAYELIAKELEKGTDFGLIVVDSFSPHFRSTYQKRETFGARSRMTAKHLAFLNLLAAKYNLAVIITCQVMGVPDEPKAMKTEVSEASRKALYGGHVLKHGPTYWIALKKKSRAKQIWEATVIDSPNLPERSTQFRIGPKGIEDIARTRGPG